MRSSVLRVVIGGGIILATGIILAYWFRGAGKQSNRISAKNISHTEGLDLSKRKTSLVRRIIKTEETEKSLRYLHHGIKSEEGSNRRIILDAVNKLNLYQIQGIDIPLQEMLKGESIEDSVKAGAILARQGDDSVKDMLSEYLKMVAPQIRFEAASGLVSLGDKSGVDILIAGLNDPNWDIRRQAAIAVGETMQPELAGVLHPLLNDPSEYVRVAAAGSMLKLGDASAKNILYNALKSPDSAIQYSAAIPLAEAGDSAPLEFFRSEFRNYDLSVKGHVAYYMALLGDKSGLPALREAAELGDEETRAFASAALIALSSEPL